MGNSMVLRDLIANLRSDQLAAINFDAVAACLEQAEKEQATLAAVCRDMKILREDYEARIAGMLKAMGVADRKQESVTEALAAIASLGAMTSEGLVATYHRVSARFRSCFPTSFGQLHPAGSSCPRRFADYKS